MSALRDISFVLAASLLTGLITSAAVAATSTDEPIAIEADSMLYDNRKQTNVFVGNVVLTQGDFEIRAERIRLRQDKSGAQFATATGSPAKFKHAQSGKPGTVEGSGKELRYNNQSQELQIINGATLRRVQAGRSADVIRGAKIVYRADRDSFSVESGKSDKSGKSGNRVRVVIHPRNTSDKGKSATLKPSRKLEK